MLPSFKDPLLSAAPRRTGDSLGRPLSTPTADALCSIPAFMQMESLFGSLPEMLDFQKVFLETLEDGISAASDFNTLETPSQFRVSSFDSGLKQNRVGRVRRPPLEKKVSLDCRQGEFSAFVALFSCGSW